MHDLAREALDQGLDEAAEHCGQPRRHRVDGGAGIRQGLGQSRANSAAHRLQCGTANKKQNRVGQSEAHRDLAFVAPAGGPQQQADGGEDLFRNKLFRLGHEAIHEREIGDVDDARELLLYVNTIQVGFASELRWWIGDLAHSQLRLRVSDRHPHVCRNTRGESWLSMTVYDDVE